MEWHLEGTLGLRFTALLAATACCRADQMECFQCSENNASTATMMHSIMDRQPSAMQMPLRESSRSWF